MNTNKVLILAGLGIGAYFLMTKGAGAATVAARPGTYSPIYPAGYGVPNAANTPAAQLDALNNSTAYGLGRFINGIFGGSSGSVGGAPLGTQPSAVAIGSGGGAWRPSTYDNAAPTYYTPGTYSVDPNSWGPPSPPADAFPTNPPGGYETPNSFLYSDVGYGEW